MRNFAFALTAALAITACGDAVIGSVPCTGELANCARKTLSLIQNLDVNFTRVATDFPATLPAPTWVMPTCSPGPCTEPIRLVRGAYGSAWTVVRTAGPPALQLLGDMGEAGLTPLAPPLPDARLDGLYLSSHPAGAAVAHVQWTLPDGSTSDRVALVGASPTPQVVTSTTRAPDGVIAVPGGYLMFGARQAAPLVRLVDAQGASLWNQGKFPDFASQVGGSAVPFADQFVVGASNGEEPGASFGLLALDGNGSVVSFAKASDSTWHGLRLEAVNSLEYAVAAESELIGVLEDQDSGHIDVLINDGGDALQGFRIMRNCFHELKLRGFSVDIEGTMYVSTQAGSRTDLHGILCRLPRGGTATCFQGAPNQLFGELVSIGPDTLLVASGDNILRIDLPRDEVPGDAGLYPPPSDAGL